MLKGATLGIMNRRETDRGRHVIVSWEGWREKQQPARITGHDDLVWHVRRVDGFWEHPDAHGPVKLPYGTLAREWRLRVHGPLPWRQGDGEQDVVIRNFGDGAGWYMSPADTTPGDSAGR